MRSDVAQHARAIGIAALLTATASVVTLAVDAGGDLGGAFRREHTIYGVAHVCLALALVPVGVSLLVARSRDVAGILIGVVALSAAQLGGVGLVAFRRWPLYAGCCSTELVSQGQVRSLAVAMASAGAVTAVLCVVALVRIGCLTRHRIDLPVVVAALTALVVAVTVPGLVVGAWSDTHELVAWAVMCSLPFAAALVVSALVERVAGLALLGAVAGSAVLVTAGSPFIALGRPPGDAMLLVVGAAAVVAATDLVAHAGRAEQGGTDPAHRAPSAS